METENKLNGIRGWLTVVIIGLFLLLLLNLLNLSTTMETKTLFDVKYIGIIIIIANSILILLPLAIIPFFFAKKKFVPRLFQIFFSFGIIIMLINIIISIINIDFIDQTVIGIPIVDLSINLPFAIWFILYFTFSKRVKNTFVNSKKPEEIENKIIE